MIKNKNILIGVTGSISIYKSLELIRLYIKAGANVKVIMTSAAKKFITPLTFETISQSKILDDENENWDKESIYNHIAIGKWADIFVIVPCSANTINKLKNGIADNILTQTALAYPKNKIIAPAANTNMIENPITKDSLKILKKNNYTIIDSVSKELACRDIGKGALSNIEDIYYLTVRELLKEKYWINRDVIISGGGTIEKIDEVRYLSNFSSGKMSASLALALYLKGANVSLVSTRGHENLIKDIKITKVESSKQMFETLDYAISKSKKKKKPYLFMVAAVSDYICNSSFKGKLKKSSLGEEWNLKLKKNIDILKSLNKEEVYSIGFKAEMDDKIAFLNAKKMLNEKKLDAVCLNIIDENNKFGSSSNKIELLLEDKKYDFSGDKIEISFEILEKFKLEFYE